MNLPRLLIAAAAVSLATAAMADDAQRQGQSPQQPSASQGASTQQQYDAQTLREVQEQLSAKGHDAGPSDGQWGPQTEQALKDFQQAQGIEPSGQLDTQTLSALGVESSAAAGGSAAGEGAAAGATTGTAAEPDAGGKTAGEASTERR